MQGGHRFKFPKSYHAARLTKCSDSAARLNSIKSRGELAGICMFVADLKA